MDGTDPKTVLAGAQTIIVLMEVYFKKRFSRQMEGHFGRCYLDDDRVTKDGLSMRIEAFRSFLRDSGIDAKVPFNLPHRMAAARAMGNTRDTRYVKDLIQCFEENSDDRVRAMCAWALGRIGDRQSRTALEEFLHGSTGVLEDEIRYALDMA